jgi:hypothetical protein
MHTEVLLLYRVHVGDAAAGFQARVQNQFASAFTR